MINTYHATPTQNKIKNTQNIINPEKSNWNTRNVLAAALGVTAIAIAAIYRQEIGSLLASGLGSQQALGKDKLARFVINPSNNTTSSTTGTIEPNAVSEIQQLIDQDKFSPIADLPGSICSQVTQYAYSMSTFVQDTVYEKLGNFCKNLPNNLEDAIQGIAEKLKAIEKEVPDLNGTVPEFFSQLEIANDQSQLATDGTSVSDVESGFIRKYPGKYASLSEIVSRIVPSIKQDDQLHKVKR